MASITGSWPGTEAGWPGAVGLRGRVGQDGEQITEFQQGPGRVVLEDGLVGLLDGIMEDAPKGLGGLQLLDDGDKLGPKRGQGAVA